MTRFAMKLARGIGLLALAGLAVLATLPASAQQPLVPETQIELTPQTIEAFLETYPQIEALGEEFERDYGRTGADPEDPAGFAMAYARHAEARQRMEAILAAHGIESMEQWAQIAYSLMIAYSFAESGENIGGLDEEMVETIDQIRSDPSIPADQREQLVGMLEQQMRQLSDYRPPEGNVELAARYADRIRAVVDPDDVP